MLPEWDGERYKSSGTLEATSEILISIHAGEESLCSFELTGNQCNWLRELELEAKLSPSGEKPQALD